MGADIHCFVEFRMAETQADEWWDFGGEFLLVRNYELFARLAGVRGGPSLVAPRGIPSDLGRRPNEAYWHLIVYDRPPKRYGEMPPEQAAECVRQGLSVYRGTCAAIEWITRDADGRETSKRVGDEHVGKPSFVSDPESHTPSWLTPDEFAAAIGDSDDVEYLALLAAMRVLERKAERVRVVFWFDN